MKPLRNQPKSNIASMMMVASSKRVCVSWVMLVSQKAQMPANRLQLNRTVGPSIRHLDITQCITGIMVAPELFGPPVLE
jgi:hypothetical protein